MTETAEPRIPKRSFQAGLGFALLLATMASAQERLDFPGYQEPSRNLRQAGDLRFLSGPQPGDALEIAKAFLLKHRTELGLTSADLDDLAVNKRYVTKDTGVTHLYLVQQFGGIEVQGASVTANVARDGSLINLNSTLVPRLKQAIRGARPQMTALQALDFGARHVGIRFPQPVQQLQSLGGASRKLQLSNGGLAARPITAKLVYQPIGTGEVRLAWRLEIDDAKAAHYWGISVDAESGRIHQLSDYVDWDSYQVFALPKESPNDGPRTIASNPADANASPFGWHDTNATAGAEFTETRGNNAHAYTDLDADNQPDANGSPNGGAGLDFSFSLDLSEQPDDYRPAAVTNLFYWNNIIHDVFYHVGFDEAAGNFQANNYGRGGLGNDDVMAEAQDGSRLNNANFATPPDGSRPRMQMFVWNQTSPRRDSDLDNGVIVHEYGHGISSRLICNAGGLTNEEQMGEGWSDFFGLVLTAKASDTATLPRPIGVYVNSTGIRSFPYTTDMANNPHTYDSIKTAAVPHGVGSVWAAMLWEVYWALVNQNGFDSNLYGGTGGNNLALRLVMDGLKLTACNPGFVDGRDAILQAELVRTNGANHCLLWTAFAKRGLGFSASQGSSGSVTDGTQAFDLPPYCTGFGAIQTEKTICRGQEASFPISVGSSLPVPVTLGATNLPGTISASFSLNPVSTVPMTSFLNLGNTDSAAPGDHSITVTADTSGQDPSTSVLLKLINPAAVPNLSSPSPDAVDQSTTPTLEWSPATDATGYILELDDSPSFDSIDYSANVTGTSHTVAQGLSLDTTYHWRVRSVNTCGPTGNSAVFSFRTDDLCGNLQVPESIYQANFESGASDWAADGGTQNTWQISTGRAFSGVQSWHASDLESRSDQRLASPSFSLPTGQNPLTLQFATYKVFETPNDDGRCWDAGILEISTDGGNSWSKFPDAKLSTDPYDANLWNDQGGNNPLTEDYGVTKAWCPQTPESWQISVANLDDYAGQTVRFRFRLGTDSASGAEGWYLDDLKIQSCVAGPATATPTVTPTVPEGSTATATRTPGSVQVASGSGTSSAVLLLLCLGLLLAARPRSKQAQNR